MVTPELVSYIQSQLAAGVTREALTSALSGQGWAAADIEQAFSAVAFPTSAAATSVSAGAAQSIATQSAVVAKAGFSIGKLILLLFGIGIVGSVGVGAYFVYSIQHSPIQQIVNSALQQEAAQGNSNYSQTQTGNSIAQTMATIASYANAQGVGAVGSTTVAGTTGVSSGTSSVPVGGNPFLSSLTGGNSLISYYSQPADLSSVSQITLSMNGSTSTMQNMQTTEFSFPVTNGNIVFSTTTSMYGSPTAAIGQTLVQSYFFDGIKVLLPLFSLCSSSDGWNTNGTWFICDKELSQPVPNPNTAIKIQEVTGPNGTMLSFEIREISSSGNFDAFSLGILRAGRLVEYYKSITIPNYSGTDFMQNTTFDQLVSQNPSANYNDMEFSYK